MAAPTRTRATEKDYTKRAVLLCTRYHRETGAAWHDDPVEWVKWLGDLRLGLKKSSWRQYKAATAFFLEQQDDGSDLLVGKARKLLDSMGQDTCLRKSRNTSTRRLKKLSREDLNRIAGSLDTARETDRLLIIWLYAGLLTGLRPHEWWQSRLDGHVLIVSNSKNTNGRANGDHRFLDLSGFSPEEMQVVMQMLLMVVGPWHDYRNAYNAASSRLRRVTRKLWPRRAKRPTLYSARHQFRADAASAGVPLEIQGALMGHGSAQTARRHYGRKRFGTGRFVVVPDPRTRIPEPPNTPGSLPAPGPVPTPVPGP